MCIMSSTTVASTVMLTETPPTTTFLMLPNDLILSCLARVSRLYYPALSLVSKSFRSIINSPELYYTRSLLDCTESCLYVCLQSKHDSNTYWFTLCRKPNGNVIDGPFANGYLLVPFPSLNSLPSNMLSVVAVGPNIYAIGGSDKEDTSVFAMDSHSHTWCQTTNMHVARVNPSANILDGKIYVTGGCKNIDSVNWMEVFDTKTRTWEFAPSPSEEMGGSFEYKSIELEGSIHVVNLKKSAAFKLNEGRWRVADLDLCSEWYRSTYYQTYCIIENVLYCLDESGNMYWYNCVDRIWRYLPGIERLPRFGCTKLVECGGKMVLLWGEDETIWCAQISLEKRQRLQIYGTVEWFGVVFTSSKQYKFVHALATTA